MSNLELTPEETQGLQTISDIVAEESAVVMSTLLDKKIEIDVQLISGADAERVGKNYPEESVMVECSFAMGFDATIVFLFNKEVVAKLSDLMMMGDGTAEFSEDHIDAIQEAVNQMLGAAATAMGGRMDSSVDFQPSTAKLVDVTNADLDFDNLTSTEFDLKIEGESSGTIELLIPYPTLQEMADKLAAAEADSGAGEAPSAGSAGDEVMASMGMPTGGGGSASMDMGSMGMDKGGGASSAAAYMASEMGDLSYLERERLELLLDVRLDVSIELGRTKMLVRDILELGPGSVVELDKMSGETVDLMINNKKMAEGEVVVVDENFGVRITHLVSMEERIRMLKTS